MATNKPRSNKPRSNKRTTKAKRSDNARSNSNMAKKAREIRSQGINVIDPEDWSSRYMPGR